MKTFDWSITVLSHHHGRFAWQIRSAEGLCFWPLIFPIASISHSCQTAWLVGHGSGSPRSLMAWKNYVSDYLLCLIEWHTSIIKSGKLLVEKRIRQNLLSNKFLELETRTNRFNSPVPHPNSGDVTKGLLFYSPSFDSTFFATQTDQY